MKYLIIILIALITVCCNTTTQTEKVPEKSKTDQRTSHPYGTGDVVYMGHLDRDGNMWFATSQEGIYKYDGHSFTNYNTDQGLCGHDVTSIVEDRDGSFWLGTENGLCRWGDTVSETIPLPHYPKKSDWLDRYYPMINPKAVSHILQDKSGDLWVGSDCAGLYRYDGHIFQSYLQEKGNLMPDSMYHNSISAIAEDNEGNIWIGSFSHGGISQYDGKKFIHHALPDGIGDGMISSIYIDRQERIWAGTRNGGIYLYNGESFLPYRNIAGDEKIAMAKFFEDSQGTLWISSYARKGIYQLVGGSVVPFEVSDSDRLIDVMSISEDGQGNIWFGGRYGLLWRWDGKALRDYTALKRVK